MTDKKTSIEVHLQPGARNSEIVGLKDAVLYIKVMALPRKGEANRALLELLARELAVNKNDLGLIRGYTSRNKVVAIEGLDSGELKKRLALALSRKDRSRK